MKRNTLPIENICREVEVSSADKSAPVETQPISYARELRALGQVLEEKHLFAVDLEVQGGVYLVHGKLIPSKHAQTSFIRFLRDLLMGTVNGSGDRGKSNDVVDLRYTAEDVDLLDATGRTKRQKSDLMPDPYSLSQILRGAGSYLDHREEIALVGISIKDRWVTLRYKTAEGQIEQAKQDIEYFYDYWVKMYLRRSNRIKLPPPGDPALIVTWDGIQIRRV